MEDKNESQPRDNPGNRSILLQGQQSTGGHKLVALVVLLIKTLVTEKSSGFLFLKVRKPII